MKILLSIKPEYAHRILNGTKKYEYRRTVANNDIDSIIIYASSPEQKVIGEVEVKGVLTMKKTPLWETTKDSSGISRKKYREYFFNSKEAHAYVLGDVKPYKNPLPLSSYGISSAPQSFIYINE